MNLTLQFIIHLKLRLGYTSPTSLVRDVDVYLWVAETILKWPYATHKFIGAFVNTPPCDSCLHLILYFCYFYHYNAITIALL